MERAKERDSALLNYPGECRPRECVATVCVRYTTSHISFFSIGPNPSPLIGNLCLFVLMDRELQKSHFARIFRYIKAIKLVINNGYIKVTKAIL